MFNFIIIIIFILSLFLANNNINRALGILLFLYLVLPEVMATRIPFFITIPKTFFIGFCLVFFVKAKFSSSLSESKALRLFLVFIIYLVINSMFSQDYQTSLKIVMQEQFLFSFIVCLFTITLIRTKDDFKLISDYLIAGIILISVIALFESITKIRFNNIIFDNHLTSLTKLDAADYMGGFDFNMRGNFNRVESTFTHSITLGLALTFFLPLMLSYRELFTKNIFVKGAVVLSCTASIFTFSRTSWISIVLFFLLFSKKNKIFLIVSVLSLIFIGLPFLDADFKATSYASSSLSAENRIQLLYVLFRDISLNNLIMGFGLSAAVGGQTATFIEFIPRDNSLAQYLFSIGIVGTGLFISMLFLFFNEVRRNFYIHEVKDGKLLKKIFSLLFLVEVAIFLISNSVFQNPRLAIVFFGVLGSFYGISLNASNKSDNEKVYRPVSLPTIAH